MTQFAISVDFLTSLSYLPRQAQRQVGSFVFKFRQDPRSPGINLERIQGARDGRLFSVRINDDYRGVVARPDGSDSVLLLWVDKHDDAYAWARRRRCEINPETGALQIVDVQTVEETAADQALANPDSRRRFWVVDDDGTLEAMLEAPLEKSRVFLHPSQRRLVERHWNGPVRVLGGAGTGKTVVAMHRPNGSPSA